MSDHPTPRPTAALIDIGANLAHDSFDHDRDALLQRAWDAGLAAIIVTGSDADSNARAAELARTQPGRLFATAGLHPHHAANWDEKLAAQIADLARHDEVVAVGECGLDYWRDLSPRDAQRRVLISQLGLAIQANKPVFLHQRGAHEDFIAILRDYRKALAGCVVHCFTDSQSALDDYLELDCHVGITGWICDDRRGLALRQQVSSIPANRLLIETDAPYLYPHNAPTMPASGTGKARKNSRRRNEPALLPWVLQSIAAARAEDAAQLAQKTSANARRLFGLGAASRPA